MYAIVLAAMPPWLDFLIIVCVVVVMACIYIAYEITVRNYKYKSNRRDTNGVLITEKHRVRFTVKLPPDMKELSSKGTVHKFFAPDGDDFFVCGPEDIGANLDDGFFVKEGVGSFDGGDEFACPFGFIGVGGDEIDEGFMGENGGAVVGGGPFGGPAEEAGKLFHADLEMRV